MKRIGLIICLFLLGCATNPPLEDYTLARSALESAKQYEAERFAPALWYQAEESYRRGQSAFKKDDFEVAKSFFVKSRQFAERAENKARKDKK